MNEPWRLDAGELVRAYADGSLSPVEALDSVLARLAEVNPRLNAVIARNDTAARDAARASAARWRSAAALSAIDGVPVSVKDNIPVAGMGCTWGSRLYATHAPRRDESPAGRLRDAGAVLFGKTNVPEFTLQGYTDNLLFGVTRNPWDTSLTPGGSSGGAVAAVAAGIGPLALATDGGGSIRRPCAFTGLVGLKPSWGMVPRADGLPDMLPGLEVIGPIARNTGDLVRILQVIAPTMRTIDASSFAARPALRIAHWQSIGDSPVDPQIARRIDDVAETLRSMGHMVVRTEAPAEVLAFNREAWPVISATGLAAVLDSIAAPDDASLTPAMAALRKTGIGLSAVALFAAQAHQSALRLAMASLFERFDALLTPANAAMPWAADTSHPARIDGKDVDARGHAVFTAFVNGAGLPALALPAEPHDSGLPIGFQLVGRPGSDAELCALGTAYETHRRRSWLWPELSTTLKHGSVGA